MLEEQVIITELPQTVSIESRTTMITLWFRGANDLLQKRVKARIEREAGERYCR